MPTTSRSIPAQLITEPKTLTTFLIGGMAIGVLGNAVYQLLTNWLTTGNWAAVRIILGALLVLVGVIWFLNRLSVRLRPAPPLPGKKSPDKRRGIIFLVSNEPTIQKAIDWHRDRLERCWLVCTEQSMPVATKIKSELSKDGRTAELVLINDVYDPIECRNKINDIYASLPEGFTESDVILDFTGMTAIASVGAVLACLDERRAIQYTPGVFDRELKVVKARDPVEVTLDWSLVRVPTDVLPKGIVTIPTASS